MVHMYVARGAVHDNALMLSSDIRRLKMYTHARANVVTVHDNVKTDREVKKKSTFSIIG